METKTDEQEHNQKCSVKRRFFAVVFTIVIASLIYSSAPHNSVIVYTDVEGAINSGYAFGNVTETIEGSATVFASIVVLVIRIVPLIIVILVIGFVVGVMTGAFDGIKRKFNF